LIVTCALWNARSVCNKLTYIHDLFTSNLFTFMAFTETWLTPSDTASTAALSYGGLHFSHTPRSTNKQGGGVGILSLTTSFGLKQWSTSSTHKDGHTLDLLFTHLCSVSICDASETKWQHPYYGILNRFVAQWKKE
ncbi:uncharacterized protein PAF06_005769, partial [Gastrophryne carolinensis]